MNKKLLFAVLLLCSSPAFAQYPGGLNTGLRVWLKANSGVTVSPLNVATQWNEVSGAGVTGNFTATGSTMSVTVNPPSYAAVGVNFNPHIAFNAAGQNVLISGNSFPASSMFDPNNNTIFQIIKLRPQTGTGVWFKWQFSNTAAYRVGNEMNTPGLVRFDFPGGTYSPNLISTVNINDVYKIVTMGTQTNKSIRLNGLNNVTGGTAALSPGTTAGKLSLGNEWTGDPYPTNIDMAEIIVYNRTLTAAERNKVESYVAVKYGITLDQSATGANDYVASDGTIIWNRTANTPFLNNITGIGRDDGDSLIQRQSRSINAIPGLVTLYNGSYTGATAPPSNILNTNNYTANTSYVLVGDNNLALTNTRCVSVNSTNYLRMNRVWKAQKTGTIGNVTVAINAVDVPANTRSILVSTDSAFSPGNTTAYLLDNVNNVLSKSIVFPAANSFFTYASDALVLAPTSNSPLCEGATLQLNSNFPGLTTYTWTGPGFTSTAANPTIVGVTTGNAGTYTLNATSGTCTLPPASVTVTVGVRPAPPTVTTPLIYCQYFNAPALTAGGTNLAWYLTPTGGGTGNPTPPIPNTQYEDTLVYWVTQSVAGCESIRTKQTIQVRYKPNGIILGTQASICQGDVDTFQYFGNARLGAIFDFKSPTGVSTRLSGSDGGPYIVRFDSAGTYRVRMQINNDGCVSDEMFFTVTVRPSPVILMTADREDACVDEVVNIALYYTTNGVTRYNYDFGAGEMVYGTATGGPYGVKWNTPGTKLIRLDANTTGCPARTTYDTIRIHPYPDARIATVTKTDICTGDSVLFTASEQDSNTRFTWTPDNFFSHGNIYRSWGVVKKDGYVRLEARSQWGCIASDSVRINAKPCCELYFPNAFTPNNDGKNDRFNVVTEGHHYIANFRIVNRWGQVVFETKDERKGWDGTYNGREQDLGTYYYYIRYQCSSSNDYIEQKGEFLLLRDRKSVV